MTDLQALIHAACTARLRDMHAASQILADWLEDHGDARAAVVRGLWPQPRFNIYFAEAIAGTKAIDGTLYHRRCELLHLFPEFGAILWDGLTFAGWAPLPVLDEMTVAVPEESEFVNLRRQMERDLMRSMGVPAPFLIKSEDME